MACGRLTLKPGYREVTLKENKVLTHHCVSLLNSETFSPLLFLGLSSWNSDAWLLRAFILTLSFPRQHCFFTSRHICDSDWTLVSCLQTCPSLQSLAMQSQGSASTFQFCQLPPVRGRQRELGAWITKKRLLLPVCLWNFSGGFLLTSILSEGAQQQQ